MSNKRSHRRVATVAACLLAVPGSVWTMDITLDPKREDLPVASSAKVIVEAVVDRRQFGNVADDASMQVSPSPDDARFNSRLIGRLPDEDGEPQLLFLTGDQTVAAVIAERVAEALRRADYRAIATSDADEENARKLAVEVTRFWVWSEDSPESKRERYFHAEVEVMIHGDVAPFSQPTFVAGDIRARGTRPQKEISWIRTGGRGVEDLVRSITVLLKFPPACAITD